MSNAYLTIGRRFLFLATLEKTAIKTARPSPRNGNCLPLGAHPGNTGGKKGRSGRRPDEFKAWLDRLLHDPDGRRVFEAYFKAGDIKRWQFAAEYTQSKPVQQIAATTKLIVEVVRE